MTRPIGYYVHHQGEGHRQRALQVASAAPTRFVLLGTGLAGRGGEVAVVDLPDDRADAATGFGADGGPDLPKALHYAPYGVAGLRRRVADLSTWIATAAPALVVVDVSVEVAFLARLASTPVVYVRLSGARTDTAHLEAFRGAEALLAPWHPRLEHSDTPDWVRARTRYFAPARRADVGPGDPDAVLVVHGRGGAPMDGAQLAAAASATPNVRWRAIGPVTAPSLAPPNLALKGWIEDVNSEIQKAGVVVGAAGDGLVDAVLGADRPFVCLPEPRPYEEQAAKAAGLAQAGAAVVLAAWPEPKAWPGIIASARSLDPQARHDLRGEGVEAAGRWLIELADRRREDNDA